MNKLGETGQLKRWNDYKRNKPKKTHIKIIKKLTVSKKDGKVLIFWKQSL